MHIETSLFFLLLILPTLTERALSFKFLPVVSFLNLFIYFSLLDSKSSVRMSCFKAMLMIFSQLSEFSAREVKPWFHCYVYCRIEGSEAQKGHSYFFSCQYCTFPAKLWEQDYRAARSPQSEGRLSAFSFCTFLLADAWLATFYAVQLKPQQIGLEQNYKFCSSSGGVFSFQ